MHDGFLQPGVVIGDGYRIEAFIRRSGVGEVWAARHVKFEDRRFAIKVLRPRILGKQTSGFDEEAQFCKAIRHRGIVDIIQWGRLDGIFPYVIMEYLEGENLEDVMERDGAMPVHRVLGLADGILDVLSAVHKAGVVHCDLKPSNLFIARQRDGTECIKLLDFSQARRIEDSHHGELVGTPEYMAPEQAEGLASTPRSDIYTLGVLLFEMLAGRFPFNTKSTLGLIRARVFIDALDIRGCAENIPDALAELLAAMLKRLPEERPQSADEVKQRLRWVFQ